MGITVLLLQEQEDEIFRSVVRPGELVDVLEQWDPRGACPPAQSLPSPSGVWRPGRVIAFNEARTHFLVRRHVSPCASELHRETDSASWLPRWKLARPGTKTAQVWLIACSQFHVAAVHVWWCAMHQVDAARLVPAIEQRVELHRDLLTTDTATTAASQTCPEIVPRCHQQPRANCQHSRVTKCSGLSASYGHVRSASQPTMRAQARNAAAPSHAFSGAITRPSAHQDHGCRSTEPHTTLVKADESAQVGTVSERIDGPVHFSDFSDNDSEAETTGSTRVPTDAELERVLQGQHKLQLELRANLLMFQSVIEQARGDPALAGGIDWSQLATLQQPTCMDALVLTDEVETAIPEPAVGVPIACSRNCAEPEPVPPTLLN
jgi:hypothetical protein